MELTDTKASDQEDARSGSMPMSTEIALALAAELDQGPMESPPLADSIDTDALDQLFRNSEDDVELTLSHAGRNIFVSAAGVTVEPKR